MSLPYKRTTLALLMIAALAGGGLAVMRAQADAPQSAAPAAPTVEVAEVKPQTIIDWQDYSGRLEAVDRVDIRPLVSGTLTAVHFHDGAYVKKGDVLFTIDPRPYAAEVDRAQAQLAAAQTRAAYAATELARGQRLAADNAIAKRDLDEKQNAAREADAQVQAAQAALTSARLNLEYTRIVAPVAGRISRAEVTVGNIVAAGAGTPPLTTLVSVDRIYAAFDVDEQSFLKYVNPAQRTKSEAVPVYLGLADEDGYSRRGGISSVDNRLDTSSGTIRVRAVFDNADGRLLPGLYARIRLGGGSPREAVLIDERAIGTDQDKRFVLVVDHDNRTAYREVRLGARQNGLRVIESGLAGGERIVVSGLQRTRPGDTVSPKDVPMNREALVDGPAQPPRSKPVVKA
ncbi:efflux RND transporter periplasmic adaptor subunit [Methyloversatilis thermotolerans]|jgi:multidrug efflux system membrane fusion protein|uniref:efflux RND transporter periplasmic adaptor subunit n=1 Tax=Methyloversatilis thermotolerans TaxID=1346290 RepID=UPI00037A9478|nr:efflux RND transporter periplasmic adaptor subunit [Methyloversatilis thermotolerans]